MATLYNQPLGVCFGNAFAAALEKPEWTSLDMAVAWVTHSGAGRVLPAMIKLLARGGRIRAIVGIDRENTSQEGLEDLLSLESHGRSETFVYHNEDEYVTFHPKLYLLGASDKDMLVVGSNNLTGAGFYSNTEVGIKIEGSHDDEAIVQARLALDAWGDLDSGFTKKLSEAFLRELVSEGYVLSEEVLRRRRRAAKNAGRPGRGAPRRPLFRRQAIALPPLASQGRPEPGRPRSPATPSIPAHTHVLLMKLRPARGTQIQIPIPLRQTFFAGHDAVVSEHDGHRRPMSATRPHRGGGAINTIKLEIPETRGMANPVARFEKSDSAITYHAYDADSPAGRAIMDSLEMGRHDSPPTTKLTKPSTPAISTWFRFI